MYELPVENASARAGAAAAAATSRRLGPRISDRSEYEAPAPAHTHHHPMSEALTLPPAERVQKKRPEQGASGNRLQSDVADQENVGLAVSPAFKYNTAARVSRQNLNFGAQLHFTFQYDRVALYPDRTALI